MSEHKIVKGLKEAVQMAREQGIQDLIARIEKAARADRSLDAEISRVLFDGSSTQVSGDAVLVFGPDGSVIARDKANYYSLSLDAAITLVPDLPAGMEKDHSANWWWSMEMLGRAKGHPRSGYIAKVFNAEGKQGYGHGDTPALAMCAAALKAMVSARARTTAQTRG